MNVTYAINIKDLRVVAATCETLKQPDYRKIDEKTAIAIEKGEVEASEVAKELLFGKHTEPLQAETKQALNVRTKPLPDPDKEEDGNTTPPAVVVPPVIETPVAPVVVPPVVVVTPAQAPTAEEIDAMTVPNLKVKAAEMGIAGYNKMKADALKAAILGTVK
jgi:hypothetical protein